MTECKFLKKYELKLENLEMRNTNKLTNNLIEILRNRLILHKNKCKICTQNELNKNGDK